MVITAPLQVGAALTAPFSQLIVSAFNFLGVGQTQGKGLWLSCRGLSPGHCPGSAVLKALEPLLREQWVWGSELWETQDLRTQSDRLFHKCEVRRGFGGIWARTAALVVVAMQIP